VERLIEDHLSARVKLIAMSPTIAMSERAAALRHEGRDVIGLSVGEPDFDTPPHIVEAAYVAARKGFTRYTAPDGAAVLKDAVRFKFARENELQFANDEIHAASGCKQVIFNAMAATLDPGDEVAVVAPYWTSYIDIIEFCGGRPVVVPARPETGFALPVDLLAERLSPRTKWVFVNTPNNPTGAVYSARQLMDLAAVVARHPRVMVLSDEIYEHLVYDGRLHVSFLQAAPAMRDRTLVVNGVSKSYAMTGWRIGFAGGPRWLIAAMAKVQSQTAGNSTTVAQAAAAVALAGEPSLIPQWRQIMAHRRNIALQILRTANRLGVSDVAGAFYLFVDVAACIGAHTRSGRVLRSDIDVTEYFLEEASVAAVPGSAFGASPYVRLSFAVADHRLKQACERIVAACRALSGPNPRS
jgi:aspartate aminotransferase